MIALRALLVAATALFAQSAFATDYYVDASHPSASDGNPGLSPDLPWATIARASQPSPGLVGGDTVWIKGGATSYQERILPKHSGSSGAPIVYQGYGTVRPLVIPDPSIGASERYCIHFKGSFAIHHFVIRNIECRGSTTSPDFTLYAAVQHATFIEIRDSLFTGGSNGIELQSGSHNKVVGNTIDPEDDVTGCGCTPECQTTGECGATAIEVDAGSQYNLIEGNDVQDGGHDALAVQSSYNVIRGNRLQNPNWRQVTVPYNCHQSTPPNGCPDAAERNVFEDNEVFGFSSTLAKTLNSIQLHAPRTIVRRNRIYGNSGNAIRLNRSGANLVPDLRDNRIYHNVFYENGLDGGSSNNPTVGFNFAVNDAPGNATGNALLNNVFNRNDEGNPSNTLQIWMGGSSISGLEDTVIGNNDILYQSAGQNVIHYKPTPPPCDGGGSPPWGLNPTTLQAFQTCYPSLVSGNLEVAPGLRDPDAASPDFRLRADSLLIDQGRFLTSAVVPGGTATDVTTFQVMDAGFFSDGYGVVDGDELQFEFSGETRRILSIDLQADPHQITLTAPLSTLQDEEGITLRYNGDAPDIGAFEWSHLIDETLESYEIVPSGDNDPVNPGDGNANNWVVTEPSNAVQVAADGGEQVLSVDNPNANAYSLQRLFTQQTDTSPTPILQQEMKIRFNDTSLNSSLLLLLSQSGQHASYLTFALGTANELVARGSDGTHAVLTDTDLQQGVWYQIRVTADLTDQHYDVEVIDLSTGVQAGAVDEIPFFNGITSVNQFRLTSSSGADPSPHRANLDLDDLAVQALSPQAASP